MARRKSGWYNQPSRHALASRGIKTRLKNKQFKNRKKIIDYDIDKKQWYWSVIRDNGQIYEEGYTESPTEAEMLANHYLKNLDESMSSKGHKLNEKAPFSSVTEFMKTYDMNRDKANRYIRKYHPMWIDYNHKMTKKELEKGNVNRLGDK